MVQDFESGIFTEGRQRGIVREGAASGTCCGLAFLRAGLCQRRCSLKAAPRTTLDSKAGYRVLSFNCANRRTCKARRCLCADCSLLRATEAVAGAAAEGFWLPGLCTNRPEAVAFRSSG